MFEIGQEIVHRLQSTRRVFWTVRAVFAEGISVESPWAWGFIAAKDLEMYELR